MNHITEQPCEDCGEVHGKEFTRHTTTKYITVKLTEDQYRLIDGLLVSYNTAVTGEELAFGRRLVSYLRKAKYFQD